MKGAGEAARLIGQSETLLRDVLVFQDKAARAAQEALAERATVINALRQIAGVAGNLPDDRLMTRTGANDAVARGCMVVNARAIALEMLARMEKETDHG